MTKKRKLKRGASGICVIASGYTWQDHANTWADYVVPTTKIFHLLNLLSNALTGICLMFYRLMGTPVQIM